MTRSRTWTIGTAVVVLAALAIGWFLLISPKRSEASELKATAEAANAQNLITEAKIRQLKLQQKQLPAQRAEIAAIQQQLPAEPLLPSMIRQTSNAAEDANVDLLGIAPSAITPLADVSGVSYIPVVITATGDFTQLKQFLFALEENKRSVLVSGFDIGKPDAGGTTEVAPDDLTITIQARVFIAGEAAPATPATPSASGSTDDPTTAPADAGTAN